MARSMLRGSHHMRGEWGVTWGVDFGTRAPCGELGESGLLHSERPCAAAGARLRARLGVELWVGARCMRSNTERESATWIAAHGLHFESSPYAQAWRLICVTHGSDHRIGLARRPA